MEAAFTAIRKKGIDLTPPFGGSRHLTPQVGIFLRFQCGITAKYPKYSLPHVKTLTCRAVGTY